MTDFLLAAGFFFAVCWAVAALQRHGGHGDPYPPEAATAPDPAVAQEYAETGLAVQRARPWTEDETCALFATGDGPARLACCPAHLKVRGWNDTQVAGVLAEMASLDLADMWSLPARLEEFYPAAEVSR